MKRLLLSLALAVATFMPTAHASPEAAVMTDVRNPDIAPTTDAQKAEIAALFTQWSAALGTGDARKVNALYAADALLLPTKSNEARVTVQAREDYFRDFLKKYPGVVATIDASPERIIRVSERKASDTGHYTFTTADGTSIKARYTFVYRQDKDGRWLISSHHSSALPESSPGA
ncbi:SgcJ/EcaC family oxidoreductase [Robbsia sp. Bb-Pol-6]|uniref:SgcJ/EcaC family oxidoreductase n=1 Tax=Robbsia betulipollinis TaxID=2981849 RepID=A0ABT3ZP59_9BURK|nr:SgcJ/EcaC family oxidoreductase [Robbsia betulipollinis]MCY0388192.1 SgcJ/EcaC family oxidoreductase [Robbsia betulipollinis]